MQVKDSSPPSTALRAGPSRVRNDNLTPFDVARLYRFVLTIWASFAVFSVKSKINGMTGTAELAEFLGELPPFENLTDDELYELAAISEEREYKDGAVVVFQGDVADAMYIVRSGRLYGERRAAGADNGPVREREDWLPGSCFGEEWLFLPGVYPYTIKAVSLHDEKARVVAIEQERFLRFLNRFPDCLEGLEPEIDPATGKILSGLELDAWRDAQKADTRKKSKSTIVPIMPDELVEFQARRSKYYLLVKLIWPTIGWLLTTALVYLIFSIQPENSFLFNVVDTAVILVSLIFLGITLFRILDWSNDYFLVTSKRIVHREFDLRTFRIDLKTARIDEVQSVEVITPSFWANHLGYGNAVIATASTFGTIVFDNIDRPIVVKESLDRLSTLVRQVDSSRKQTALRHSIDNYFTVNNQYDVLHPPEESDAPAPRRQTDLTSSLLKSFRERFAWRVAEGNVVTYRKHYIVLLFMTATQLAGFALLLLIAYLIVSFFPITPVQVAPFFLVIALLNLAWFIWEVEDWRNDIFQVTDRMVIDIDRKPFGFGQSQKQAPLERIQNVNAYTPGLLHTLFNYGNVDIETAGDAINIHFDDVPYPSIIVSDIFARLDELEIKAFERQTASRHTEYMLLLDIYQQEREQNRIGARTPQQIPPLEE